MGRAEILFRAGVKPFDRARDVLETLVDGKVEEVDLLELCSIVPKEVLGLGGGKGYDPDHDPEEESSFSSWLRCYNVPGMNNMVDNNGRTMWYKGAAGSM